MEYAEVYMLLLRKTTMAPVVGEAMGELFWGQIDLNGWTWNLSNEKRIAALKAKDQNPDPALKKARADRDARNAQREKQRLLQQMQVFNKAGNQDAVKATLEKLQRLEKASGPKDDTPGSLKNDKDDDDKDDDDGNPLKFTFEKRLDTASTQMLNMMKGGVPFEKAAVTIVHRAGIISKVPGLLAIQFSNLLLTSYDLTVTQDETGTELKESWEAEFTHVMFEYSRRMDPVSSSNALASARGKQIFIMKPRGLPL